MIKKLAVNSYTTIKIMAASMLLIVTFLKYLFNVEMSLPIVAVFFLIVGIYVGYVVAYYSIKYLRDEDVKKKLPLNWIEFQNAWWCAQKYDSFQLIEDQW